MKALAVFVLLPLMTLVATAGPTGMSSGWWRSNKAVKLTIDGLSTNVVTWSCSPITITRRDSANRKSTLGVDVVSFAGSNAYFYSNSVCSEEITGATITAPASSVVVYLGYAVPGAQAINVTSGTLLSAVQNNTVALNSFTWTGGAGTTDWHTAGNWSGGVVPTNTAGQVAHFDSNCVSNCSAEINANMTVRGVYLHYGYAGTVTQKPGFTITTGGSGFVQNAGTFVGGNGAISSIPLLKISGGTFTSTSGTLTTNVDLQILSSATFHHNSGSFLITDGTNLKIENHTLYSLTFSQNADGLSLLNTEFTVLNLLEFLEGGIVTSLNTGIINLKGNINIPGTGKSGSTIVRLNGNSNQTITSLGAIGALPFIEIASTGGTVTISGNIGLGNGYKYTSGVVDTSAAIFTFSGDNTIWPGTISYNEVVFGGTGSEINLSGETMTVAGNLTITDTSSSAATLSNGTILALGNVNCSSNGKYGSAVLTIGGSLSQSVSSLSVSCRLPGVNIMSTGGIVTFAGTFVLNQDWTHTSGTVALAASQLRFVNDLSINPGSVQYADVEFGGSSKDIAVNGTMTIFGTLTLADTSSVSTGYITTGTIELHGDLTLTGYGKIGDGLVKIIGSGNQTINGSTNGIIPRLEVASTGGNVTFSSSIRVYGNYTYSSGTVVTTGSTLRFLNDNTVIPGSVVYNNVVFGGANQDHDLLGATMKVGGTLSLADTSSSFGTITNATIEVSGDVSLSGYGKGGTYLVKLVGVWHQSVTSVSASPRISNFEIASTGGVVSFVGTIYFKDDYTYTSGTVDSGISTVVFYGYDHPQSVVPGNFSYYNVSFPSYTNGNLSLNGGTINVLGQLTLSDSSSSVIEQINNGTINAYGDVIFSLNGRAGNAVLNIVGTTATTLTDGGRNLDTTIYVNKTGGGNLTLANAFSSSTGQSMNVISGQVLMAGNSLTVSGSLTLNGNTLTKGGGVLTVGGVAQGTGAILGGTVLP